MKALLVVIFFSFSLRFCGPDDSHYRYVKENYIVFNQDSSHGILLAKIQPTRGSFLLNDKYVLHFRYCQWNLTDSSLSYNMKVGDSLYYDHEHKRFKLYDKTHKSLKNRIRYYSSSYCDN